MNIEELARETGLSRRTISFYKSRHLVPKPLGRGPAAVYSEIHLWALNLIKKFQGEGMSLEQILKWFSTKRQDVKAYEQTLRQEWLRYIISPDIELHIRKQVGTEYKDIINKIMGAVMIIYEERDSLKK